MPVLRQSRNHHSDVNRFSMSPKLLIREAAGVLMTDNVPRWSPNFPGTPQNWCASFCRGTRPYEAASACAGSKLSEERHQKLVGLIQLFSKDR